MNLKGPRHTRAHKGALLQGCCPIPNPNFKPPLEKERRAPALPQASEPGGDAPQTPPRSWASTIPPVAAAPPGPGPGDVPTPPARAYLRLVTRLVLKL